jgi:hypothetical protein
MENGPEGVDGGSEKRVAEELQKEEKYSKLNQIYLLIISRYKGYIEEKEELSVAELPTLVTPKGQLVLRKTDEIKNSIENYSYEANFYEASMTIFNFVKNDIEDITLPLQFWLTPEEIMRFMIGDITDKNILLCSLFIALGNPSSKVLVIIEDSEREIKVYYEFNNKITLFDITNGSIKEFETKEKMLESFNMNDETAAYEFNDQMYVDIR